MLKICLIVSFALTGLAGCVSNSSNLQNQNGPAYMQPKIGAPTRQTDFFGNSLRR